MTDLANRVLQAFDALSVADRHEVSVEVLRRVIDDAPSEISEDALIIAAEELFLELDANSAREDGI
jgi:hypothetical protein